MPEAGRQFCTEQLRGVLSDGPGRDEVLDDAALLVSELLTNAVRARCRIARLSLAVHRDVLRISVADDAPGLPRYRSPGDLRDSDDGTPGGWGLGILGHLASDWAVEDLIPGKEVWAELPIPRELTLDMADCHRPFRFDPPDTASVDVAQLPDIKDLATRDGLHPEPAASLNQDGSTAKHGD